MNYIEKLEQIRLLQKELSDEKHRLIQKHIGSDRNELRNKLADEMMGINVN